MATKKIKINFKMPTPTAAERLHAQQQKNRKAAGLPDPSEYKKKLDAMKSENYEEDDGPLSQEQLDEISAQLKASYVSGAKKQIKQSMPFTKKTDEYRDIAKNFIAKRQKGIAKANEEVEQLDEMPESSMKTRDVHSHLKKAGWALARSGGGHDVYKHPKAKHSIPVPRHNQLKAPLIRGIMKASKVEESFRIGGMGSGGRGNVHMYDRNPGPKDGSELENVPFHAKTEKQKKLQNALTDLGKKMKEIHPKLREANDPQEYDYEGDMAKSDLRSIMHHAKELHDMLDDDTNLAEWCQSKITLAEDYLSTVANYMRSEMSEETVQEDKNDYQRKIEKNNKNFIAASKRQKNPLTNVHTAQTKQKPVQKEEVEQLDELKRSTVSSYLLKKGKQFYGTTVHQGSGSPEVKKDVKNMQRAVSRMSGQKPVQKEEVDLDEVVIISTKKPIGTRVADIGPGGKEYNVKTDKAWDDSKKKQPQGAEFAAQRRKERLAKNGRMDESSHDAPFNKPYNKDSGTTTDKSGAKHTPMSKARHLARQAMNKTADKPVKESASEPTEGEMKGKQGYSRKAQIVMNAAKGKKSDNPDKYQKDPELSSEIHKT